MIRSMPAMAAIVLAAGALGGCHRGGGQGYGPVNGDLCRPFHTSDGPQLNTNDQAAVFDDCLHRWGYSLAAGRDQADVVASAVNAACATSLTRWNQQTLGQQSMAQQAAPGAPPGGAAAPEQGATDLATGQPTDMMTARAQFAQSRALFYVLEARAGGCAPPPGKPPANEP
jgi:hypothetical protein